MAAPKPLRFFWCEADGDVFALTPDSLRDVAELVETEVLGPDNKPIYREQSVEEVAQSLDVEGNGRWVELHIKAPKWKDQIAAESAAMESGEGGMRLNRSRVPGCLLEQLVQHWTIPGYTPNANGYEDLPPMPALVVKQYLDERMFPTANQHPGFMKLWSAKQAVLQRSA